MAYHPNPESKKDKPFPSPGASGRFRITCSDAQSKKGVLRCDFYGKPRSESLLQALSFKYSDLIVNGLAKKVQTSIFWRVAFPS